MEGETLRLYIGLYISMEGVETSHVVRNRDIKALGL